MSLTLEGFVTYAESLDPSFPSRIIGANQSEIRDLASLVPIAIPEVYLRFLQLMGKSDGGMRFFRNAATNIDAIVEAYSGHQDDYFESVLRGDDRHMLIIAYGSEVSDGICSGFLNTNNMEIFIGYDDLPEIFHAQSLIHLCYRTAFFRKVTAAFSSSMVCTPKKLKDPFAWVYVRDALITMGFFEEEFSDTCYRVLRREDAAVSLSQIDMVGTWGHFGILILGGSQNTVFQIYSELGWQGLLMLV